jgi:hypothetical protein
VRTPNIQHGWHYKYFSRAALANSPANHSKRRNLGREEGVLSFVSSTPNKIIKQRTLGIF